MESVKTRQSPWRLPNTTPTSFGGLTELRSERGGYLPKVTHLILATELGLEIRSPALYFYSIWLFSVDFFLPNHFIWIDTAWKSRPSVLPKPTEWEKLAHTQRVFNFM